jgi:hypothetical protein
MKNMSQKATRKVTHKAKVSASHMGSHVPKQPPARLSEPSGPKEDSSTNNGIVPGLFSGYSKRFTPRVSMGNENNGIDSGNGCIMDKLRNISGLDELPDAQIVERKVYQGERVAHLYAFGPLAEKIIAMGGHEDTVIIIVKKLSMDDVDTVETILDAEGYSVSRA